MSSWERDIDEFLSQEKKELEAESVRKAADLHRRNDEAALAAHNDELARGYVGGTIRPALDGLRKKLDDQAGRSVKVTEYGHGGYGLAIDITGPGEVEFKYIVSVRPGDLSVVGQWTFTGWQGRRHGPKSEELANRDFETTIAAVTEDDIVGHAWRAYTSELKASTTSAK